MERRPGLVSVVIPVFNRPRMLREAVASVLAQTYRPLDVVIVDDGSTDSTAKVCRELREADPTAVRTLRISNSGPGRAREAGRREARGEFLQYVDSDDILRPRKIGMNVDMLREQPDCDVAYCGVSLEHSGEPRGVLSGASVGRSSVFPHLLTGRIWCTDAPLWRAAFTDRMGPWADLAAEEDLEYDARAGALGARLCWTPETLVLVRHHHGERASGGGSVDPRKLRARYESHVLVLRHAQAAGVAAGTREMKQYARELFHLCRLCGAAGLKRESRHLLEVASEAGGRDGVSGGERLAYRTAAAVVGWRGAGRLAVAFDRIRGSRVSRGTA